jgi:hypothetical protein
MMARIERGARGTTASVPSLVLASVVLILAAGALNVAGAARAAGGEPVLVGLAGESGTPGPVGLVLEPDPVVLLRAHPEPPTWRLDPEARGAAHTFAVSFENGSPFVTAAGTSAAEFPLSLGPLEPPIELGSYAYVVRLFAETGVILAETRGTVRVEESTGLARRAALLLAVIGVVFLLFNYLDTKPYTRSYEH